MKTTSPDVKWGLKRLFQICTRILAAGLETKNAASILDLAEK